MSEQSKFSCQACGKKYTWKPELAGKRAKCKCGQMMTVPQRVDEPDLDALYDLVEDDAPARPQRANPAPGMAMATAAAPAQQAGVRCPSCSAAMQPGAVLCVTCGFNLKTGRKVSAAGGGGVPPIARPAPAAMGSAVPGQFGNVPPSLGPKRMQAVSHETDGSQKKMIIVGVVAILLIAGLVGGFVMLKQGAGESNVAYKFEDEAISKQLREDAHTEVKEFLDNRMFSLLGMTTSQAKGFADNLYKLGAKDVRAFDGRVSMSIVVELPEDPAQRKDLIDHFNRYHEGNREVPKATDEGQKYLKYRLKIANV